MICYITTSFKDPGVMKAIKPTHPQSGETKGGQSLDMINTVQAIETITASGPGVSKASLEDENSEPINISAFGNNPISNNDKEEGSEPKISFRNEESIRDQNDYIETRLCSICLIEQPLRTRHCRKCKKCIALYDHHCV